MQVHHHPLTKKQKIAFFSNYGLIEKLSGTNIATHYGHGKLHLLPHCRQKSSCQIHI
jgi:hypothetical protein